MKEIAESPAGLVLLCFVAVGLVTLVLWQLSEAIWGHRTIHGGKRALRIAVNLAEVALFGVLARSAGSVATHGGSSAPSKSFAEVVASSNSAARARSRRDGRFASARSAGLHQVSCTGFPA
ncbi:MAG: DUF1206 domain-containing protein [Pseudonocardia sp.]|nr:DUF1206 domain-containing protein [Pseudonocardia sp.]